MQVRITPTAPQGSCRWDSLGSILTWRGWLSSTLWWSWNKGFPYRRSTSERRDSTLTFSLNSVNYILHCYTFLLIFLLYIKTGKQRQVFALANAKKSGCGLFDGTVSTAGVTYIETHKGGWLRNVQKQRMWSHACWPVSVRIFTPLHAWNASLTWLRIKFHYTTDQDGNINICSKADRKVKKWSWHISKYYPGNWKENKVNKISVRTASIPTRSEQGSSKTSQICHHFANPLGYGD